MKSYRLNQSEKSELITRFMRDSAVEEAYRKELGSYLTYLVSLFFSSSQALVASSEYKQAKQTTYLENNILTNTLLSKVNDTVHLADASGGISLARVSYATKKTLTVDSAWKDALLDGMISPSPILAGGSRGRSVQLFGDYRYSLPKASEFPEGQLRTLSTLDFKIVLTQEQSDELLKRTKSLDSISERLKETVRACVNVLSSLNTVRRIEDESPELAKYLAERPEKQLPSIVQSLDLIRKAV